MCLRLTLGSNPAVPTGWCPGPDSVRRAPLLDVVDEADDDAVAASSGVEPAVDSSKVLLLLLV